MTPQFKGKVNSCNLTPLLELRGPTVTKYRYKYYNHLHKI